MQSTRLHRIFGQGGERLVIWFQQPWRSLSLEVIALLLGTWLGDAVSAISGQAAMWDPPLAIAFTLLAELVSWAYYRTRGDRPFTLVLSNLLKIGFSYGFILQAFKLGS